MSYSIARRAAAVAACALTLGLATGCGSSGSSSAGGTSTSGNSTGASAAVPTPAVDPAVAAQVPAAIKARGTLIDAADATGDAPNNFVASDGTTVVGMAADLAHALGAVMGLKVDVVKTSFDSIIPGLQAGKYDFAVSSHTDTREREQTVDFVTYFSAGTAFMVKAQGGPAVTRLADVCGLTIAVNKGSTQADQVTAQAKECSEKTTVSVFPTQDAANLALSTGRADVVMGDSPVTAYAVKQSEGQFKLSGHPYGTAPYGMAIPKDSGMTRVFLAAMRKLVADGTYMAILRRWGLESGAISAPKINGAVS